MQHDDSCTTGSALQQEESRVAVSLPNQNSCAKAVRRPLRIACLIPSATDICVALGLSEFIVGITHECQPPPPPSGKHDETTNRVRILTSDGVHAAVSSQGDIHAAVQAQSNRVAAESVSSNHGSDNSSNLVSSLVPSLYPIVATELAAARPNLVFTQDLCGVCAPASATVQSMLACIRSSNDNIIALEDVIEEDDTVEIVSLTPQSLSDVVATFDTIATACGIPEQGKALQATFWASLDSLQQVILSHSSSHQQPPRMLLLEWLDPPFDAGHWMLDMMERVLVVNAMDQKSSESSSRKSRQRTWDQLSAVDPDVVLVACCGFDLERNLVDAQSMATSRLIPAFARAAHRHTILACHGDAYFANPGPNLVLGTAIMALAAYKDEPTLVQAIRELPFVPTDFVPYLVVDLGSPSTDANTVHLTTPDSNSVHEIGKEAENDIEDFDTLHRAACQAGQHSYLDPSTGYSVFTELAHRARGKCCGSGCRHCPFAHENVRDKTAKIQQPAFLHVAETTSEDNLFDVKHGNCHVLFCSGGKDSFLALRAMVQLALQHAMSLVLLTTFDATSRIIAHQDISIDTIVQQARHLNLSLVGVPMHRQSSEGYVQRVRRGLDVIEQRIGVPIHALVFGDLHLEHIKGWRDDQLGPLGYRLLYPLFGVSFEVLEQDLENSQVPCEVTSTTVDVVQVGEMYNADFRLRLLKEAPSVDLFGENGEFHTVAQVWKVDRSLALGLP
jgi:diphthamide synthase (EF-2-diphthine--ammonia ligase)/ABC-type Fe3+-hydroxamate transport system substrate-binding protein